MSWNKMDFLYNLWWIMLVFAIGWIVSFMFNVWWFNRHKLFKTIQSAKNRRKNTGVIDASYIDFIQAARVGFKIKDDADFEVIEGIGPTTSELLKKLGYSDLIDLANAKPDAIKQALIEVNSNYRWIDTDTWPKQAEIARSNKWYELKGLQDHLMTKAVSETAILNRF
jgi:predicted flap endonuclease-1-like 5' DNA nuclease